MSNEMLLVFITNLYAIGFNFLTLSSKDLPRFISYHGYLLWILAVINSFIMMNIK